MKKILKTSKDVICIILGTFFILGAIAMISEDITATIVFGIIGLACIFGGRGIFLKKNNIKSEGESKNTKTPEKDIESVIEENKPKNILANCNVEVGKRIYNYINEMIRENEDVVALVNGAYEGKNMYLLATNKRIIIFNKGLLSSTQVEIPIEKINSIGQSKGIIFGEIHIWDSSSKIVITNVHKNDIDKFVKIANEQMDNYKSFKIEVNKTTERDTMDKIEKLAELHKEGTLTDYEFATKKMELLDNLKK